MNFPHKILVGTTDKYPQDIQAMMLAKYSRDYGPIESRMPSTPEEEASLSERMAKYYLGYGHKSVGQLGGTTIFFEGVSQIAAKALEDNPLFNGQESSTRYIDFRKQPMVDCGNPVVRAFQEELRALYIEAVGVMTERIMALYPFEMPASGDADKARATWRDTIKARVFDICRGILPAGVVTNVGYKGTFDNLNDHLGFLTNHPCNEVSRLAYEAIHTANIAYPMAMKPLDEQIAANNYLQPEHYYLSKPGNSVDLVLQSMLSRYDTDVLRGRLTHRTAKGQKLPVSVSAAVRFKMTNLLDFGSFRDLQRHRNGVCQIPLITGEYGIHPWYLMELGTDLGTRLQAIQDKIAKVVKDAKAEEMIEYVMQYAMPLGTNVLFTYECDLNQLIYLIELRTGKTSHQTLRHLMGQTYHRMKDLLGIDEKTKIGVFPDLDTDNFTLKRGTQHFDV